MKRCTKCKELKDESEFGKAKRQKSGLKSRCKKCHNEDNRDYSRKNPDKEKEWAKNYKDKNFDKIRERQQKFRDENKSVIQNRRLKCRYNITLEQYDEMVMGQNGLCKICGQPEKFKNPDGTIKLLSVDHNHETGLVRGLLCNSCNLAIGYFKEDVEILQSIIKYLNEYGGKYNGLNKEQRKANIKKIWLETKCSDKEKYPNKQDLSRNYQLKYQYGILLEDYNQMIEEQNGLCKICGQPEKLYIDHNHATDQIRGLLCRQCNAGIGGFNEDTAIVLNAIQYISANKGCNYYKYLKKI